MREILQPVHHHREQSVAVTRWRLMAGLQRKHVPRCKRRELGVDRCSLASLESETIRKVCQAVPICQFQQDKSGIASGGVE